MPSKSRNESSKPRSQRVLAPAVLLLALVGVLVWGLWRVLGPEKSAASKPEAGIAKEATRVAVEPVPTQAATPVAATAPAQPTPAPGVPTVVPVPPAAPPVPVPAPASELSPLSPLVVVSNAVPALVGLTSAPVVLSTQILRASVANRAGRTGDFLWLHRWRGRRSNRFRIKSVSIAARLGANRLAGSQHP